MKRLVTYLHARYNLSTEESNIVAFNITIYSVVAAIALVGVILNLVGVI